MPSEKILAAKKQVVANLVEGCRYIRICFRSWTYSRAGYKHA